MLSSVVMLKDSLRVKGSIQFTDTATVVRLKLLYLSFLCSSDLHGAGTADMQNAISGVNFLPRNLVTFLLAKGILTMTEIYAQACNSVFHTQACNGALGIGM